MKHLPEYLVEGHNDQSGYFFRSQQVVYETQTKYQKLEIHEIDYYGKILRLDDIFQTSERDEFLYHEPLIHVPGIALGGPKRGLVIGGGDGGAIEEMLKYNSVQEVVMVEIDEEVVNAARKFLPNISNNAFDDPRLDLRFEDGINYVKTANRPFDQVMLDLTDCFGPSLELYTQEFYQSVHKILNPNGALSLHIESPYTRPITFNRLYATLQSVFKYVRIMLNYVPVYGASWGYAVASDNIDPLQISKQSIVERIDSLGLHSLQFYNPETHFALMAMPNFVKDLIKTPTEVVTQTNKQSISAEPIVHLHLGYIE